MGKLKTAYFGCSEFYLKVKLNVRLNATRERLNIIRSVGRELTQAARTRIVKIFCSFLAVKLIFIWASLVAQVIKNLPAVQETWVRSLGQEDPLERRAWQPTPVFLPGEFHRGAWRVAVHGVAKSQTQLSNTLLVCKFIYLACCSEIS